MEVFSQSVEPIYLEARDAGSPGTIATAVADDCFFQSTLGDVASVLTAMIDICKREGVELTLSKCYLFDPYDDSKPTPPAAVQLAKDNGIDLKKGCAIQLGAAIGLDEAKRINYITSKIDSIVKSAHQTVSSMSFPAQCVPKYLQQVAKTSAVYLAATHSPQIMREPLLRLANQLHDTLLCKVDATASKSALTAIQMKMDIKLGGLGLRGPNPHSVFMTAAERAVPFFPTNRTYGAHDQPTQTMAAALAAAKLIRSDLKIQDEHTLPSSIRDNGLLVHTGCDLKQRQMAITDALGARNMETIASKAAEKSDPGYEVLARRMEDLSSTSARRLWTTHPHAYGTGKGFRNGPYRIILLHALGMHISNKVPAKCACNHAFSPDHPHCCVDIRRKAVTDRHDGITKTFGDICKDAGCQVTLEPTMRLANQQVKQSNKRADAIVTTPDGTTFCIDTSVIHTTAKTYTNISVADQLNNRAQMKIGKYAHIAQAQKQKFYPFILTTMGTFHDQAIGVLTRIANIAKEQARAHCEKAFLKQSINKLLDTLHKGNIHLLQYALNRLNNSI
jgi:hypothetical protein